MSGIIAQFIIPSDSIGSPYTFASGGCAVDWEVNQQAYLYNSNGLRSYSVASFATQNPINSVAFASSSVTTGCICTKDGYVLLQHAGDTSGAYGVIRKFDPTSLTSIASWGGAAYPNGLIQLRNSLGQALATIMVNGVPYALGAEVTGLNGGIIRTDTMTASGWYGAIRTTGTAGAYLTAGQTGGSAQGTFYTCDQNNSGTDTALAITKITVLASASSYNIASWPTSNASISSTIIATLTPTQINASWTTLQSLSIGYDVQDDVVIVQVCQFGTSDPSYFVGLSPAGTILWVTLSPSSSTPDLSQTVASQGKVFLLGNGSPATVEAMFGGTGYVPAFATGTVSGLGSAYRAYISNDVLQNVIACFNYTQATGTAVPASGTASSFSGWAMLSAWPNNFAVGSQIWFRRNGGNWNDNPYANPATGVGGLDMSRTRSKKMYVIAKGADVTFTFNFGASSFVHSVPSGFTAGWPSASGGWSSFDAAKLNGSATLVTSTNVHCPTIFGAAASIDGWYEGSYYFEYTVNGLSFFSDYGGGGVMRYEILGPSPTNVNIWTNSAFNGSGDPNGGANISGGTSPSFTATAYASGGSISNIFTQVTNDVISVAVVLVAQNVPQVFQPVF